MRDLTLTAGVEATLAEALKTLRASGAIFAYLHGSQAAGTARPDSDIDLAAFFGARVNAWDVLLPRGVDLLVLDTAPLELRGRISLQGRLLLDTDPAARVQWEATTRKIWSDERPRFERAHREFMETLTRG